MGLSSEMKILSEEMLASFKQRIKENEELVLEVQKTLDGFHKDHQEMTAVLNTNAITLRKDLSQGERERLKTFRSLMAGINGTISTIQKEVVAIQTSTFNMVKGFNADRSQMAAALDQTFASNRTDRMKDEKARMAEFDALMKDINEDIKSINEEVLSIFNETNEMLGQFDKEHQEMSADLRSELSINLNERVDFTRNLLAGFQKRLSEISQENQKIAKQLRRDLSKGETERVGNYKGMMKGIHAAIKAVQKDVKDIRKNTAGLLGDYASDREGASAEWNKMQVAITQIRKSGIVDPPKPAKKKEVAAEVKVEAAPVVKVEVQPVDSEEVKPVVEVQPLVLMTLEEKVLDYISQHPNGLKISEMEQPLGETRMKLGFIAKALLDEGKVQKVENVYFPLK